MLTAIIIATSLLFAAIITIDFASGLIKLWENAGAKPSLRVELATVFEQPTAEEQTSSNQLKPASALPDFWTLPGEEVTIALPTEQPSVKRHLLLSPARVQIATLEWIESNLPPVETFIVEMPCVIAMAKSRLCKTAPVVVELATKAQLQSSGIRKLKQLAREIKLSGYSNMRVAQLAAALEGKVATHQLAA